MTNTHRFLVIGAGGVGGWLSEGLVRMLEYKAPGSMLVIVDGDTFEARNKERQNFDALGNKAEVLANQLQPAYNQTIVMPIPSWVVAETNHQHTEDEDGPQPAGKVAASDLLANGDVVYAVVDNFKCRKDICDAAAKVDNIDVFLGGNNEDLSGSVYHYRRRDGKDVTDHPSVMNEEYVNPPDRNPGEMSCAERAKIEGGTQFIAANFAVAAFLLGRTQETILTDGNFAANEIHFDTALGMAAAFDRSVEKVEVLV